MNKLSSILFGVVLFVFATFTGTSAFAAPATDCKTIGETVYKGDPRYLSRLDTDADGAICEKVTITVPVNGGGVTVPDNAPPAQTGTRGPDGKLIDNRTCAEVGRTKIPVGDPDYSLSRDRDRDGFACDLGPDYSTNRQVDASGNLTQLDSNGTPVTPNTTENKDNLANTGFDAIAIWGGVGLLIAGAGFIFLFRKLRSAN